MSYKVCLLDDDIAYQQALMEYLNLQAKIPVQLYVFTSREKFGIFREKESPHLLLVGDEYTDVEDVCPRLILTKKKQHQGDDRYLFRYQSAETLLADMIDAIKPDTSPQAESGICAAVYAPLGRCGKTSYAKKLCEGFARSLYVNWEGIPGEVPDDDAGSYFLYCMKSRNEECFAYLQERGCRVVPPPEHFRDIRQAEEEDVKWFLNGIRRRKLYDSVVFDIGATVLSGYAVLKAFDCVYVPTLADGISQTKIKVFERILEQESVACNLQFVMPEESSSWN